MQIIFKTLDHKTFSMEVDVDGTVEDLICQIEDEMGRENKYKLSYDGKPLKEEKPLCYYYFNMINKIPINLMVIKPQNNDGSSNEKPESSDIAHLKRTRTVTEDSGFEDDCNNNNFVSNTELTNFIEIIHALEFITKTKDSAIITTECTSIIVKLCEKETKEKTAHVNEISCSFLDESIARDESDEEEDTNIKSLIEDEGEIEFQDTSSNLQNADMLTIEKSTSSKFFSVYRKSNPLDFLRDIEQFQFLRHIVLQDPKQLQPLFLSFVQSHPGIMKIINKNKDFLVRMIHQHTGTKPIGMPHTITKD